MRSAMEKYSLKSTLNFSKKIALDTPSKVRSPNIA